MNSAKFHISLIILLVAPLVLAAQDKWEKPPGGIENAQVIIEKDKVIKLRPVSRRFKAISIEIPQPKPITFNYQLKHAVDSLPSLQVIVRPKTMRDQPLDKFYALNAKLGYGNYQSPYVLLNAGTKRSDEYMLNAYLNHYSSGKGPVLDDLSAAGVTKIGISGKYFLNNISLSGNANYKNHSYSIYGWDPVEISNIGFDKDSLKQKLNVYSFNAGIADNNLKNKLDYNINLGVNYLNNTNAVHEFIFDINGYLSSKLSDQWFIDVNADFTSFNQNDSIGGDISRRYIQLKPVISYHLDKFKVIAGVNAVNQNDPLEMGESKFHFFPVLGINYEISNNHLFRALIDGTVEKVSLNSLYNENPFLDSLIQANNNVNNISGLLGLEGKLLNNLGYTVSFQYKHYNRLMFFQNIAADTARFNVVYDQGGVSLNRFFAKLDYLINDQVNISGDIAYNVYSTTDVTEAWHRPAFEASITSDFKIISNLRGHLTYFLLNGIKAQTAAGETKTLDTIHDFNVGLELSISERAGIFVELMNVFGGNYQRFNNYPVKGFQVIGGLSYKF